MNTRLWINLEQRCPNRYWVLSSYWVFHICLYVKNSIRTQYSIPILDTSDLESLNFFLREMFLLVWYVPFYPSVSSTSLSHLLFFNFSPIPETFRHHFDTILVRRTLKCLIMVVLFRALENESRYSILIAINYYAIYFDCILNCINCSKRSSVQELFECFYFCWNKMVIFGPFGTIEPLCTSSNQNNTKMVLFNWTNYFILSLIDFLKVPIRAS